MSLSLKIASLFIRTAAKPIGNYIKRQAREHEPFRKLCVSFAQNLHRIDMRMRLGLLQDPAVIERQIARETKEAAAAEARRRAAQAPTVPTEAEAKELAKREADSKHSIEEKVKREEKERRPKIRPLSEAKAIDSGANFISETFLFLVAGGLILFETWRGRKKEGSRRGAVEERLEALENETREGRKLREEADTELESLRQLVVKMGGKVPQRTGEAAATKSEESVKAEDVRKPSAKKSTDGSKGAPSESSRPADGNASSEGPVKDGREAATPKR